MYLLDLHGNSKKKEKAPDGGKDENVFDIQQGVAIGLFVRSPLPAGDGLEMRAKCQVHHAELWGEREGKYRQLLENEVESTEWRCIEPQAPYYLFAPQDVDLLGEYEAGWKINEIMPVNSVGIVTARDDLTIHWNKEEVWETVQNFSSLPSEEARDKYSLGKDARDWKVSLAQNDLKSGKGLSKDYIKPILYRPFDVRYTYYTGKTRGFICMPRPEVMPNLLAGKNRALSTTRSIEIGRGCEHVFCSNHMMQHHTVSIKEVNYTFPLYCYSSAQKTDLLKPEKLERRQPNFAPSFIAALQQDLDFSFIYDGQGDLEKTIGPEDVFNYAYAVFHSPTYRSHYAGFLKMDFPRLPLTSDRVLLQKLCILGAELTALHLMECDAPAIASYPVAGTNRIDAVRYSEPNNDTLGRVWINTVQYFQGIPPEVWNFHIGGYQVLSK